MNLSSYLQMPPAPNAPKSPTSGPASGSAAGARVDAGNSLGLDFAHIMARQLERLPQMQRQDLAAPAPLTRAAQEVSTHQTQKRSVDQDDRSAERDARDDLPNRSQRAAPRREDSAARDAQAKSNTSEDTDAADAQQNASRTTRKATTAQEHMDAALLQAMAALPAAATPMGVAASAPESASSDQPHSLQTIALSPQIQIITDPQQAPSHESLAAFAKSMGLDEATIQSLLANGANSSAKTDATPLNAALSQTSAANLLNTALTSPSGPHSASQALMAALGPNADALPTDAATGNPATPTAAHATATITLPGGASLLGPQVQAFPGSLLPPMSAADLASIEHIQITVMPAVTTSGTTANTPALPSTQDVLSLLTGDLKEQDITRLSAQFGDSGGNEQPADQHQGHASSPSTGFGQVLSGANNSQAGATTSANATPTPQMSEVYEQLSDKLATEMATRLHKQLSDGQWKMTFGLRPAHLGGVEIQLEMKDGKLDAVFRADNPLTRDLLQNSSQRLREALENFGIHAGLVHVGQQGGQGKQNTSRHSANQPQLGDNSTLQVKGDDSVNATTVASNKANASLLDLYA